MSLLVDPYEILERNKSTIRVCHECHFVAAWMVRKTPWPEGETPFVAFSCTEHIDRVLYLVESGRLHGEKVVDNG